MLAITKYDGPEAAMPCLIAHGLYGSARNWGVIAKRLSASRPVWCVDMRNHGLSPHFPSHSYTDLAADLAEVIEHHGHAMDVIGHSMGGKAAMVLALTRPELVNRLLVADIAPVTYTHTQLHVLEAMQAVDLHSVVRRSDAADALAAQGLDPQLQSFLTQSLDVAGRKWRYNLETLKADMPKIMSFPDLDGAFDGPTLFLSGAQSDYVLPEHRDAIKAFFPKARFAKLSNAGHWLHAEQPRAFQLSAETFLSTA